MAETVKTKLCLICNKLVPGDIFEKHFVECRRKRLNVEQQKANPPLTSPGIQPPKKGCGCGRKK